jgi:hypothetical protein
MQSVYLQRIMMKNADRGCERTKPKQSQFLKKAKMSATSMLRKDYRNQRYDGPESTLSLALLLSSQPYREAAGLLPLADNLLYDIIVLQEFSALCVAEIHGRYCEKSVIA